jgi:hypothetical protein
MEKHVTAVGVLQIGMAVLGIMVAAIVLVILVGTGFLVLYTEGEGLPLTVLAIVGASVAFVLVITALPGLIGGIGLLKRKSWARILVMIVAVLEMLNVPIGTAVGVYTLWVLLQDQTEQLFA